jgi:TIR domain
VFELRGESAIQTSGVFISYTHVDSEFIDALERKLNEKRIHFWRDVHHASAGRLDRIVDRAMRLNPTVLLVLSEHSVTSDWVEDEVDRARELEKELGRDVLCPIALDEAWKDCAWSRPLRTQIKKYHVLPFGEWRDPASFERMFRRLVEGLSIFYHD